MDLSAITELYYVVAVPDPGAASQAVVCASTRPCTGPVPCRCRWIGIVWRWGFPNESGVRTLAALVPAHVARAVSAVRDIRTVA